MNSNYPVEIRDTWKAPTGTGVALITMPNVPRPLHGLPPRKIMGQANWDKMRKRCYYNAHYKCEICGCEPPKGQLHAHELYTINYTEGTSEFNRCIAICKQDHDFIHSGRLVTLYKQGNPLYPKNYVLSVVEKGFKLIHDINEKYDIELKAYATFLEYLKVPSLRMEMEKLIEKYNIKFYSEPKKIAKWAKWRLIWKGKEYPTPYKNVKEWQEAMVEYGKADTKRQAKDPFQGKSYDILDEILKGA